ncbi:hypothetical protein HDU79_002776 [Rhizoclosmatium sp. JEL0117]|nr:hypothetical protein HDU79_002776 [Rhizoclosmatium sp. JEL0117]
MSQLEHDHDHTSVRTSLASAADLLRSAEEAASNVARQRDEAEARLRVLATDFHFNLAVLEERDAEIDSLEQDTRRLRTLIADRDSTLSDLKMRLADSSSNLDSAREFARAQEAAHQETLRKIRRDNETAIQEYIHTAMQKDQQMSELQTTCDLKLKSYTDELASLRDVDKRLKETQWEFVDYKKQATSDIACLKHELNKLNQQLDAQSAFHESRTLEERTEHESKEKALQSHVQTLQREIEALSETNLSLEYHIKSAADSNKRALKELEGKIELRESEIEKLSAKLEKASEKIDKMKENHDVKTRKLNDKISADKKKSESAMAEMEAAFLQQVY